MLAISVRQPFAFLIVHGHKPVENRDWPLPNKYALPLRCLIHASRTFNLQAYRWVKKRFPQIVLPEPEEFDCGGVVGVVNIIDCVTEYDSPWFTGQYGFVLACPRSVPFVPFAGNLRFFDVPYKLIRAG